MNANSVFSSSLLLINSPQVYSALLTLACQKDLILKTKDGGEKKSPPKRAPSGWVAGNSKTASPGGRQLRGGDPCSMGLSFTRIKCQFIGIGSSRVSENHDIERSGPIKIHLLHDLFGGLAPEYANHPRIEQLI
jgi:hypothetical protein